MPYTREEKDRRLFEILNSLAQKEAEDKKEVIRTLNALADDLDKHSRNHKIADLTFASSGIVATGLTIAGVATAPFTFGTSLGLTIGGLALGVSSGAGTIGNTIVGKIIKSKTFEQAQKAKDKYFETSNQLLKISKVLNESGKNEILFADLTAETFGSSRPKPGKAAAFGLLNTVGATGQGLRVAAVASAIATREVIDSATRTMAGVLKSGLMAAKVAGAVISTLSVPLDIYTIFVNSKALHNKTPAEGAQEIRMALQSIEHLKILKDPPSRLQISSDRKEPDFLDASDALQSIITENDALKKLLYCTNCFTRQADLICLPCGHVTCCSTCIRHFRVCTLCKDPVRGVTGDVSAEVIDTLSSFFEDSAQGQELDPDWVILDEDICSQDVEQITLTDTLEEEEDDDSCLEPVDPDISGELELMEICRDTSEDLT